MLLFYLFQRQCEKPVIKIKQYSSYTFFICIRLNGGGAGGKKRLIMMKTDFETAVSIFERELKYAQHVKDCLLGNAASARKIMDLVIQAINSNVDKSECLDVFRKILNDNGVFDRYETTYTGIVEMLFEVLERYNREYRAKRRNVIDK